MGVALAIWTVVIVFRPAALRVVCSLFYPKNLRKWKYEYAADEDNGEKVRLSEKG